MSKPILKEKDILNPNEAIELFVLSRRKFYKLLKDDNVNIKFTKNDRLKITNFDHIYSSRESRTSFVL